MPSKTLKKSINIFLVLIKVYTIIQPFCGRLFENNTSNRRRENGKSPFLM